MEYIKLIDGHLPRIFGLIKLVSNTLVSESVSMSVKGNGKNLNTVAILAQGTSWADACSQAFLDFLLVVAIPT